MKTIGTIANYMKHLLPVDMPSDFAIDDVYLDGIKRDTAWYGVCSFKSFLDKLYTYIMTDESLSIIPKKGKDKFSDETTLTVEFPLLNNIKSILINTGYYGKLSEEANTIIVTEWDQFSLKSSLNKNSTTKISTAQMIKSLKVLSQCGMVFRGIDLNEKKPDVHNIDVIEISYPEDQLVLRGWTILARAQMALATRKNDDILLRCDYRVLNNHEVDIYSVLKESIASLSQGIQEFILKSHKKYLELGMTCELDKGFLCSQFIYSYKRKAIWRFSISYHNGYRMILKTKHTSKYSHLIEAFPTELKTRIQKGYGCDRKTGTGHGNCQRGCEGYTFPLDHSLLAINDAITLWQEQEILCM